MPELGPLVAPVFMRHKTKPVWLGPREVVRVRHILPEDDSAYPIFWSTNSLTHKSWIGELMWLVIKEGPKPVFSTSPLGKFSRMARMHLPEAQAVSLERCQQLISLFLSAGHDMRQWRQLSPFTHELRTQELRLASERLLRAHTMFRLLAGMRVDLYAEYFDSLGRPNPMIAGNQFVLSAQHMAKQGELDQRWSSAILRRHELAELMWTQIAQEVADLLEYLATPVGSGTKLELYAKLEGLQIKPFKDAVSYAVTLAEQPELRMDTRQLIADAFVAEYMLVEVDFALSQIKRNAHNLETLPLLSGVSPVPLPETAEFEHALPRLDFDAPYKKLSTRLLGNYQEMAALFRAKDYKAVKALAGDTQKVIHNRLDLGVVWRQPMITEGRIPKAA